MLEKYRVCRSGMIFIAPNGHEHSLTCDAKSGLPLIERPNRPYVLLLGGRAKHKDVQVIPDEAKALVAPGAERTSAYINPKELSYLA
jgi:hypothetical protein